MSTRKTDDFRSDPVTPRVVARTATQPEEDSRVLLDMLAGWRQDIQPRTHMEAFLCRELAVTEWRLERTRRIENGILWWAVDDIRDRNHDSASHGHPTGEEEMSPEDFITLTFGRAFKLASSQADCLQRLARIEAGLIRRMYKALDILKKERAQAKR